MPNLLDIKRRIKSTKNTQQITKAMKLVSASKLRRASESAMGARPYAERIFDVHRSVLDNLPEATGELYNVSEEGKTLVVVIAADKGLCGSFNSNIFKNVVNMVEGKDEDQFSFMVVGRKAVNYFNHFGRDTVAKYSDVFRNIDFNTAEEIAQRCIDLFLDGSVNRVVLLYNKFVNVLVQEVTERQILPLTSDEKETEPKDGIEHLAEPDLETILEELAPQVVKIQVFQALLESSAAEHAARMTAMDAATSNAKDMIDQLTLEMNKARQAAITTELIEVVSGAAAL
jgi:F-type H+-transporting ATPase subunit gamma